MSQKVYTVNPPGDTSSGENGEPGMWQSMAIEIDNPAYEPQELQDNTPAPPYEPSAQTPVEVPLPQVKITNGVNGAAPQGKPRRVSRVVKGSTLTCHDLYYTVQVPNPGGRMCSKVPKQILRAVNGIFKPGMNAIMGPTGGGKTTMLDTLAGRKNKSCITGTLLIDGHKVPDNFRCMSGYVVQDDVVMGTLTVRENIMFSANLRLSKAITREEKEERVEETLQELGLTRCADSKVGNEFIRGVSGGERKRTNIGMELIIGPRVLFLDEPTTGLDSSTSNAVMALLKRLSKRGRTIVFSIHQPRYSIFKFFDRLTLMAAGRTAYHGPAQEALEYFTQIGYVCEEHNNPPDFFLDVINGDSSAVQSFEAHKGKHTEDDDDDDMDVIEAGNVASVNAVGSEPNKTLAEVLADKFNASVWHKDNMAELDPIYSDYQNKKNNPDNIEDIEYATGFVTQLRYIAKRNLMNILRNPQASVLQLAVTILFAVVVGLIFLRLGDKYESGIQNRIGVLFFVVVNQMFANLSSVELFIKERTIFLHETSSGFYRVSAFFFSKLFCDLIPLRIFPLICFSLITYFMVGLQEDAGKFFIYFFTLFLGTMCASAIGFAISATVRVFAIANLLVSVCFVLMMIFGGLLVNVGKMGKWLSWLQYLSVARYGLNALSINELKDIVLIHHEENGTTWADAKAGPDYLEDQGIDHLTAWDLWQNHLALGLICIGIMTLAYVQLRRLKESK